jgi:4-hydroxyphenylpyruvate dioxygenase
MASNATPASANPCGLDGMEFIEFAVAPGFRDPELLEKLMQRTGTVLVARHKTRPLRLYRQNQVNFVINEDPESEAVRFARTHGPAATATGFRVKNAAHAFATAVARGARPFNDENAKSGFAGHPAIYGIGDSLVYFLDRYPQNTPGQEIWDDWNWITTDKRPRGKGMMVIDHMTNNVPVGEMQKWCDFYTQVFGFEERRYFDIKGKSTGLISKVMQSPCRKFCIPINEPTDPKSQIQEYLDEYKGSGIQHIALLTNDIAESVASMIKEQIEFLKAPPTTYYNALPKRIPVKIHEQLDRMQELGILIDGDERGYLLQIFTKNQVGPIFLEIIQRRGHDGFGEGNFQALFDSIEEDQRLRGVL